MRKRPSCHRISSVTAQEDTSTDEKAKKPLDCTIGPAFLLQRDRVANVTDIIMDILERIQRVLVLLLQVGVVGESRRFAHELLHLDRIILDTWLLELSQSAMVIPDGGRAL
ncbi:hypothetical protein KCU65_g149, partial [Aureobasidium melanogenum]